ncbi:PH domain-containing protein [Microlunatus soli]|uniref:PH domain-containing protein n=1 Tax=Microlunatus soli TaxID=630515 RepID=A0A1H1XX79_9ACTN|nr:PH domain-containing protein [Microlunatus soli]SDT13499.1 PH domain-containing protein [Microlunatus soli]
MSKDHEPTDTDGSGQLTFHPRRLRIVGAIFAGALVIVVIIGWIALPPHLKALFTPFQLITLLGVLVVIVGMITGLALSTVRADRQGVWLRNGLSVRRFDWSEVHRVVYRDGDPWPTLQVGDPDDPRRQMLLGIQRSDGARAGRAVAELRRLMSAGRAH